MNRGPPQQEMKVASTRRRARGWRWWLRAGALTVAVVLPPVLAIAWAIHFGRSNWVDWLNRAVPLATAETGGQALGVGRASGGPEMAYRGEGRVDLGHYCVRMFNPITRVSQQANFQLEGVTACRNQRAFEAFIKSNHRFFREQVMISVRNSKQDELIDPDLRLLKRRIVARVNLALDEPFLKSVAIKDFGLLESIDDSAFVSGNPVAPAAP